MIVAYSFVVLTALGAVCTELVFGYIPGHQNGNHFHTTAVESSPKAISGQAGVSFHVAPMQCYTNRHLRLLYKLLSPKSVLWTEMEKVEDVNESDAACYRRLSHDERESPLVLQLGGDCPLRMKEAARRALAFQFDEINLNVGCPSVETGGANYGAALMLRPELTRNLAESVSSVTDKPVSVKCRIGVHERLADDGSTPPDSYEFLHKFVEEVTTSGAVSHLIVHARSAVLGGLSPSKNRIVPPLKYEFVHQLARDFPGLKITLNGGINDLKSLQQQSEECLRSGVTGIMAGRWLLQNPLDLWEIDHQPYVIHHGGSTSSSGGDRVTWIDRGVRRLSASKEDAVRQYIEYACAQIDERFYPKSDIIMPLLLVTEQLNDAYRWYAYYSDPTTSSQDDGMDTSPLSQTVPLLSEDEIASIYKVLWDGASVISGDGGASSRTSARAGASVSASVESDTGFDPQFRKLSQRLVQTMGKKVANKITRNRKELYIA